MPSKIKIFSVGSQKSFNSFILKWLDLHLHLNISHVPPSCEETVQKVLSSAVTMKFLTLCHNLPQTRHTDGPQLCHCLCEITSPSAAVTLTWLQHSQQKHNTGHYETPNSKIQENTVIKKEPTYFSSLFILPTAAVKLLWCIWELLRTS